MIEKVAKAINKDRGIREYGEWEFYIPFAIAAITAMKDSTESMQEDGLEIMIHTENTIQDVEDIWKIMIDTALKE